MIFSIRSKLFSTLLLAVSSVVLCMYLVMQWSFDRGFLNYVNKQDQQAHEAFAQVMANEWKRSGSWQNLKDNRRRWGSLLESDFGLSLPPPPAGQPPEFQRPPPGSRRPPLGFRPPPQKRDQPGAFNDQRSFSGNHPPKNHLPPPSGPKPPFLLDQNKTVIFGRSESIHDLILYPITVINNDELKVVGYLGQLPKKELTDQLDLSFVEQQSDTFMLVAGLMILISMLAALPVAAHLVKPIRRLMHGTQRLTSGQYETTIPITSKDELGQLSKNFNSLANTLKENEKARRQWVADISHELRTPLSVLKGEIEAIQDGIRQASPEAMNSLHGEVEQLNRLIGDLYELSMSDIGALNYQKENLKPLNILNTTLDLFKYEFEQQGIELVYSPTSSSESSFIHGDSTRLKQLFSNLLKNTLRYTDTPGELHVEHEITAAEIKLHFKDSAPGVSQQELGLLFERLYRVEGSRNRALGGAGLGLSICNNIATAHDGEITAKASPYGGIWITVTLPLLKTQTG